MYNGSPVKRQLQYTNAYSRVSVKFTIIMLYYDCTTVVYYIPIYNRNNDDDMTLNLFFLKKNHQVVGIYTRFMVLRTVNDKM